MKFFFKPRKKQEAIRQKASIRFRIFRSFVQLCKKNKIHLYIFSLKKKNLNHVIVICFWNQEEKRREIMIAYFKILNKWLNGRLIFFFYFIIFFNVIYFIVLCMLYIIYKVYLWILKRCIFAKKRRYGEVDIASFTVIHYEEDYPSNHSLTISLFLLLRELRCNK